MTLPRFEHPCLKCGACCSIFRVSFHWSETLPESFQVPEELTCVTSPHRLSMKGTENQTHRCVALKGELGDSVSCTIYDQRSSTCRDFKASFEHGTRNAACDRARASLQLAPLTEESWPKMGQTFGIPFAK